MQDGLCCDFAVLSEKYIAACLEVSTYIWGAQLCVTLSLFLSLLPSVPYHTLQPWQWSETFWEAAGIRKGCVFPSSHPSPSGWSQCCVQQWKRCTHCTLSTQTKDWLRSTVIPRVDTIIQSAISHTWLPSLVTLTTTLCTLTTHFYGTQVFLFPYYNLFCLLYHFLTISPLFNIAPTIIHASASYYSLSAKCPLLGKCPCTLMSYVMSKHSWALAWLAGSAAVSILLSLLSPIYSVH